MSTEENKAVVRRWFQANNQHNLDMVDEVFADPLVWNNEEITLQELKQTFSYVLSAFPDFYVTNEDLIAEGKKVVFRNSLSATHKGEWMGTPPTGKRVTWTGIGIFRFAGGKIVEYWHNADYLGLLQQLGAIPPLGEGEG